MPAIRDDAFQLAEPATPGRLGERLRRIAPDIDRAAALSALARRPDIGEPERIEDLAAILRDPAEPPALRFAAAAELGRLRAAAGAQALSSALDVALSPEQPELVARGAAQALLLSGAIEPAQVKAALGRRAELSSRLRLPLTLYALRRRLDPQELGVPPLTAPGGEPFTPRRRLAAPMAAREVSAEVAKRVARDAALALGEIAIDRKSSVRLQCGEQDMVVGLVPGSLSAESRAEARGRSALLGVVSAHYDVEGESWDPRYVIVSKPRGRRSAALDLLLLDPTGAPALAGELEQGGDAPSFIVRALRRPGATAAEIRGHVEDGRLAIDLAVSELRKSEKLRPTRLAPGVAAGGR